MNVLSRALAAALSLSIVLSASDRAAAQAVAARVGPAAVSGVSGASILALGGPSLALPAPSLQAGLAPALAPSIALAPVLSAPAVAAPVALQPLVAPAAAVAGKAAEAPAPARALSALQGGGAALSAASKTGTPDSPRAALDGLFEGAEAKPEALAVSALSAPSDAPRLDSSSPRGPPESPLVPASGPKTSLKRTFAVGLLAGVAPILFTYGAMFAAHLLGYDFHPNYHGPLSDAEKVLPGLLPALGLWLGAAVMAPVAEEAMFRGGMQGTLAKLSAKLHLGRFVLPALITAAAFAALHESSDPVLFGTRMAHALVLSYVYRKEGILASMAAHGFFNGLLALTLVFAALGAPVLVLAAAPAALWYSYKSIKFLRSQKPEIASGALVPKPLSWSTSLLFAGMLILAYLFLMPNIFWPIGALALIINGVIKLKKSSK